MANVRSPNAPAGSGEYLPPPDRPRPAGAQRLLEAAVVEFAARGYHGVSVRELAATVGVKAASVYAHFPSKEALLAELVRSGHEAHQVAVRDAILGAGPDPVEQLRTAVVANVRFHGTYPLLASVANAELHALSAENQEEALRLRTASIVMLTSVVERGLDTGAFRCEHPFLALTAVGSMTIRLASWYRPPWMRTDDSPLDRYLNTSLDGISDDEDDLDVIAAAYADYALAVLKAVDTP